MPGGAGADRTQEGDVSISGGPSVVVVDHSSSQNASASDGLSAGAVNVARPAASVGRAGAAGADGAASAGGAAAIGAGGAGAGGAASDDANAEGLAGSGTADFGAAPSNGEAADRATTAPCGGSRRDCNGDAVDGCEVDDSSDSHHCGACDHDCAGGACNGGRCEPVELATGLSQPMRVAVDGSYVYWVDGVHGTTLQKVSRTTLIGERQQMLFATERKVVDVKSDDYHTYWAESPSVDATSADGTIWRIASGGDSVEKVVAGAAPLSLAVSGSSVLWGDAMDAAVHCASVVDTTQTIVTPSKIVSYALAATNDTVYGISTYAGLFAVSGGSYVVPATARRWNGITVAASDANVYAWFATDDISTLGRFSKTFSEEPVALFTERDSLAPAGGLATDDAFVYFGEPDGIYRVAIAGGGPAALVVQTSVSVPSIVVRGRVLYWVEPSPDTAGAVRKLAVFP